MAQTAPKRPGRPKKEEPLFKDKIYTIEKGGGILFRIRPEAIVFGDPWRYKCLQFLRAHRTGPEDLCRLHQTIDYLQTISSDYMDLYK